MENRNSSIGSMSRETLMNSIRAEDFALYETVLYLDGHPKDKSALAYYEQKKQVLEMLRGEYVRRFGPLTVYDSNGDTWHWIDKPWPWEKEAN